MVITDQERRLGQRKTTHLQILLCGIHVNTLPINTCMTHKSPTTPNLSDLTFHALKVKSDGAIGLPIDDFLLLFNSNVGDNSAPLRDISLEILSDLDLDLLGSPKVLYQDVVWLTIHDFG